MGQVQHQQHLEVKNDISYKYGLLTRDNLGMPKSGFSQGKGRLSTVDLLIKVACFVKK
jgi:hypothetical protein